MPLTPGTRLGVYEILSVLGAGGFGEVYEARDTRLGRTVAIKVLPAADAESKSRFRREAQTIAALHHPHICALFDIGHEAGTDYLVLEHLRGETLADRLQKGRLSFDEGIRIAIEIADAVGNAHSAHVVHRDLKPANVMLTDAGVKLLDFGLAKLREDKVVSTSGSSTRVIPTATATGGVVGTLHYMAPEQLEGKEADARTDIWAFGCVLYEIFAGHRLFDASKREAINVHPRSVRRIVLKCVEREPAQRWQSIAELRHALLSARARPWPAWLAAAALVLVVIAAAIGFRVVSSKPTPTPLQHPQTVLVADFRNSTGEAVFDGVIDRAVSVALESSSLINVYPRRDALAAASQISQAATLDETVARLVSRREGITTLITGGISKSSEGYDLSVAVVDPVSGNPLALVTERSIAKANVLATVSRIGEELRAAIGDTVSSADRDVSREVFTTSSLDAAKAYATAQELSASGREDEAIPHYQDAIRIDPSFGRAHAGLALSLDRLGREAEAAEHFQKAISLLARMNRRERLRTEGLYTSRLLDDHAKAAAIYRTLVTEYPADVVGLNNLAVSEFMLGRFEQAFESGRAAVALSPNYVLARVNLALYAMYAGRFVEALEEAHRALRLNDKAPKAYIPLGVIAAISGNDDEAAGWYQKMRDTTAQGEWLSELAIADLLAARQRFAEAEQRLLRRVAADEKSKNATATAYDYAFLAEIAAVGGRKADVLRFANRSRATSADPLFTYLAANALLDVGDVAAAREAVNELKRSTNTQAKTYTAILNAELSVLSGGDHRAVLEAARATGAWWAVYRAAVVLSRMHKPEAADAWRWCREHLAQGTAAFLTDVPTVRYYAAVAASDAQAPRARP